MSNIFLDVTNSVGGGFNKTVASAANGIQNGLVPTYHEWNGSPKFVRPNLIFVMLQEPKGMKYLPDGNERSALIKDFLERQAKRVSGINYGLSVEFAETVIGNDGDMFETPTKTTRERSVPSFVGDELEGRLYTTLFNDWITDLMKDPHTGRAGVLRQKVYLDAGRPAITPDFRSMVGLFFEPNPTMDGVVSAVIVYNMMPKATTAELSKEVGGAGEVPEITVDFTGSTQHGYAPKAIAKEYLAALNMQGLAPMELRGAVTGQSTLMASVSETRSHQAQLNRVATELPSGTANPTAGAVDSLIDTFTSAL
jgi:hypothetical protein